MGQSRQDVTVETDKLTIFETVAYDIFDHERN